MRRFCVAARVAATPGHPAETLISEPPILATRGFFAACRFSFGIAWTHAPRVLVAVIVLALAGGVAPVLATASIGYLITTLASSSGSSGDLQGAVLGLVAFGAATLIQRVVPIQAQIATRELERRCAVVWERAVLTQTNNLDGLAPFEDPDLLDRIQALVESEDAPARVVSGVLNMCERSITVIGIGIVLVSVSPYAAALVLLSAVPELLVERRLAIVESDAFLRLSAARRRAHAVRRWLLDPAYLKDARVFGAGPALVEHAVDARLELNEIERRVDRTSLRLHTSLAALGTLVSLAAIGLTFADVVGGSSDVGSIAVVLTAITSVQSALAAIAIGAGELGLAVAPIGWFRWFEQRSSGKPLAPADLCAAGLAVSFEGVWFRHSTDGPWVLRDVTFSVPIGARIAIVGPNGAGKSTIAKLMLELYRPTRGAVRTQGPAGATHAAVFQDFAQFDLSVADNIGLVDLPDAVSLARVEAAARRADLHDAISRLPQGYETVLTRSFSADEPAAAFTLSGGLWQRLALARALYAEPSLVILDEPSSAQDSSGEAMLLRWLVDLPAPMTAVVVTHRPAVAETADLVLVVNGGAVEASGPPALLRRTSPGYRTFLGHEAAADRQDGPPPTSAPQSSRRRLTGRRRPKKGSQWAPS